MEIVIIRPPLIYGPGVKGNFQHMINWLQKGYPLPLKTINNKRSFVSIYNLVDLVLHAFQFASQGDIFVQKSPSSTVADLAQALIELFRSQSSIRVIGTRHGEKLYESLVSREEMAKAEDMDQYYRISADNRDLNYKKYFVEGEERISNLDDYTSHNTKRLTIDEIKTLLLKLDYIQEALDA